MRAATAAACLAPLVGCAVMRIDVDVYKGPLADHIDVQVQEFAVMAQGAKPLLIQLRDILQWPDEYDRQCARRSPWYKSGYFTNDREPLLVDAEQRRQQNIALGAAADGFPVLCGPGVSANIWNEQAERVNAVLSLYEDRTPSPYSLVAQEFRQAVNRYRNAATYLDGLDALGNRRNKQLWAEISAGFIPTEVPTDRADGPLKDRLGFEPPSSLMKDLQLAYKEFFGLPLESGDTYTTTFDDNERFASQRVRRVYDEIIDAAPGPTKELLKAGMLSEAGVQSANLLFTQLLKEDVRNAHIKALFTNLQGKPARLFSEEVKHIAESFLAARKAAYDTWVLSLDALVLLHASKEFGDREDSAADRESSAQVEKLTASYAEVVDRLTQYGYLLAFLVTPSAEPSAVQVAAGQALIPSSYATLRELVSPPRSPPSAQLDRYESTMQAEAEKAKGEISVNLKRVLRERPLDAVAWLRAADHWIRQAGPDAFKARAFNQAGETGCPENNEACVFYMFPEVYRKYGIVRGPIGHEIVSRELAGSVENILALSAVGLDRGRLDEGLETLLENYLEAHSPQNPLDVNEVRKAHEVHELERLTDAMLRFAKTVLIIADNDKLLNDDSTSNASAAQRSQISRLERENGVSDREPIGRRAGLYDRNRKELNRYILVLQAVGNSIRIQADELRHWQKYNERLADRQDGELVGFIEAFSLTNEEILETYLDKLRDMTAKNEVELEAIKLQVEVGKELTSLFTSGTSTSLLIFPAPGDPLADIKRPLIEMLRLQSAHEILSGSSPATAADRAQIDTKVEDTAKTFTNGVISGEEARGVIATHLAEAVAAYPPALRAAARPTLLKNAERYFAEDALGAFTGIKAQAGQEVVKAIAVQIQEVRQPIGGLLSKLKEKVDEKNAELKKSLTAADSETNRTRAATSALERLRGQILKQAKAVDEISRPGDLKQIALALLDQDVPHADCATRATDPACASYALVAALTEPEVSGQAIATRMRDEKEDSKDILDDLIAMLRYDLVRAIKEDGESSIQAKQAGEALKAAYDQRAGLAYIRPAGAYLRSSYPSTSLQDDPGLTWTNMLVDHGLRTTPFVGKFYRDYVTNRDAAEITTEIDKQYWQNINSVRVAGAGLSNYVIAKDPVGNWYVKSYSSDPKDIIQSARNLALFSMSTPQSGDLLARLRQREAADAGTSDGPPPTPTAPASGPLEQLLTKHQSRYADATSADFADLKKLVDSPDSSQLTGDIRRSFSNNADTKAGDRLAKFEAALATASGESFAAAETKLQAVNDSATPSAKAKAIIEGLKELQTLPAIFQTQVRSKEIVTSAKSTLEARKSEREKAQAAYDAAPETPPATTLPASPAEAGAGTATPKPDNKNELKAALEDAKQQEAAAAADLQSAERAEQFAIGEAERILRKYLGDYIQRRRKAIDEYEAAVVFIGDANNPEPPPSTPVAPADPTR